MLSKDQIIAIIKDAIDGLQRSGAIETAFPVEPGTVVLGADSPLDSIGFVTLVTDVEERVSASTGKDISITLMEIDNFNENDPRLTVDRFAGYVAQLT
jgi:acyl carrier protein